MAAKRKLAEQIRELRKQQGLSDKELAELQRKLGQTIRQLREKRDLSQEALADECGLHRTYVGSVERGERNPTIGSLKTFAIALETSLTNLVKGL